MLNLSAPPPLVVPLRGWNAEKVTEFQEGYYSFLGIAKVNSKELGTVCLGDHLYRAQRRFFDGVFTGLAEDVHDFKHPKSRQLGVSTGTRSLVTYWMGMFDGIKGAMIYDTSGHREAARLEILSMIEMLPKSANFPGIERENRDFLELKNGSLMTFMAAGVKETKSSGVLGRSGDYNLVHASEICSWSNEAGLESFKNSLAQDYENRLYIWESTGRGFNQWHEMVEEAGQDPHQKVIFSGWWAKDNQIIEHDDPDFERFGLSQPSDTEARKIRAVKELYGWEITPEQLAWIRRKNNPVAHAMGDADADYEPSNMRLQEQPWILEDVFLYTGANFFDNEKLTNLKNSTSSEKYQTFRYEAGVEFTDCQIYKAHTSKAVELKVWEEPQHDSTYVVAIDPAHGTNEKNDRSAIQVLRCFADGADQVAEYAWPLITTKQLAWVALSIAAWYAGETSDIYLILELQGGGEAVWDEMQSLKRELNSGYLAQKAEQKGLQNVFRNVRNYVFTRSDSMSAGRAWHLKTTEQLKVKFMERFRDFVNNGMLVIRSKALLTEMESITRSGDSIGAEGSKKDDRVLAMAFAVHCWEQRTRRVLVPQRRTREADAAKRRLMISDQVKLFNRSQLDSFFAVKYGARHSRQRAERQLAWRRGR